MSGSTSILIDGYYGFNNLGDEAVLRGILKDMAAAAPEAHIRVMSHDPQLTSRLHSVAAVNRYDFAQVTAAVESSDVVVVGGGGLFHEHYRLRLRDLMIHNYFSTTCILAKAFDKPLYYYAIGLGPFFTEEGFAVGRFVVSLADSLAVRDEYSLEFARYLKSKNVVMTADPAFLLSPTGKIEKSNERIVFISLREWVDRPLEERIIKEISRAVTEMVNTGLAERIVFLPFQIWDQEEHNDTRLFPKLIAALPENMHDKVSQSIVTDPQEMINLLSQGSLVIGERLHSSILAASAGIPFIALGYDRKVEYLCRGLGLTDLCLNVSKDFSNDLIEKARYICENEDKVKSEITSGVFILKQQAELNRKYFREFLQALTIPAPTAILTGVDLQGEILSDLRKKAEKLWDQSESLTSDIMKNAAVLSAIRAEIQQKDLRIGSLEADIISARNIIHDKDLRVEALVSELSAAHGEIRDRDLRIHLLDADVTSIRKEAQDKDLRVEALASELSAAHGEIRDRDTRIASFKGSQRDAERQMSELDNDINRLRTELAQKTFTLGEIYRSDGWRLLMFYYRIRDRILPEDSRKRIAAKHILRKTLRMCRRMGGGHRHWQEGHNIVSAGEKKHDIYEASSATTVLPHADSLPAISTLVTSVRAIAFYLPQYHAIPENDQWWGKGFTEWTNVLKAKPYFEGHYQPHVPAELGYYDLSIPEVRHAQADLARKYGIYGFCYYHYWFNGKRLLHEPLDAIFASGEPDFPFCICWANEDWTRAWDGRSGEILISQNYSNEDDLEHISFLARFFNDKRYIRIDEKPLFLVYRANRMPDPARTTHIWREEARKKGIGELYLCRVESFPDEHTDPRSIGFDGAVEFQPDWTNLGSPLPLPLNHSVYGYEDVVKQMLQKESPPYTRFPCVMPSWDNSARRQKDAFIFTGSNPDLYERWLEGVVQRTGDNKPDERIVFINAWNEWGEGNHLEPDEKYGRSYLEATRRVVLGFERLVFSPPVQPLVSLIIPVHNQWQYTYACLKSVLERCSGIPYEVITADDLSTDETKNIALHVEHIQVIRNEEQLGFLKNCNKAAQLAKGKYIVFLNNDTLVMEGWLQALVNCMEHDNRIGMVGSKIIAPNGTLLEAGSIVWNDGHAANYGRTDSPDLPEYNYMKEVDYVSGASIMIRRELWEQIGGFDELYSPAYYEDTDLAFEVRKHGYIVVLQPRSVIVHFEGISHGTDVTSSVKRYQVINHERFFNKWKDTLHATQLENTSKNLFLARDRSQYKKTLLVIDNTVPDYDKHAGSRTIFQYLKLFIQMGLNVKFLDNNAIEYGVKYEPYVGVLEQLGIEVLYGDWYQNNWKKWIKEQGQDLDYVYLHKAHPSIKYIDFVRNHTRARIIYNCADFHYLRKVRQYKITKDPKDLKEAQELKKTEFQLFDKSNVILTYSEQERQILAKKMPHKSVFVTPIFFYDEDFPLGADTGFDDRSGILFVGGFGHTPNIDAVNWFANEIFPRLHEKNPNISLTIIGSNPPDEILHLQSPKINVTGFVSDEKLTEYYSRARLVIAPIRFGAGVKGKIIEAIAHCVPVVTTTIGIEGIMAADGVVSVADNEDLLTTSILGLYDQKESWQEMHRRQLEYSKKYLSTKYTRSFMNPVLDEQPYQALKS
jgi:polysaccharide pyruvyl transferase CsaB